MQNLGDRKGECKNDKGKQETKNVSRDKAIWNLRW